jgi:hypothetical protein
MALKSPIGANPRAATVRRKTGGTKRAEPARAYEGAGDVSIARELD